ncbi:MAG: type II secretion system protein [Campylobacteraceae bacterium]|nr:type II secretion system protein [Campylobacteraceae bacterium]
MKKTFSILELIFVLSIISILVLFFMNNIPNIVFNQKNIFKIKVDIALIRSSIQKNFRLKLLKKTEAKYINFLDEVKINKEGEYLFTGTKKDILINNIILSSSLEKKKEYSWIKVSKSKYILYINSNNIEFIYDNTNGNFDCNIKNELCKEINE